MDIERIIKRLYKAKNTYDSVVGNVESKLFDKINFEFSIEYQPSDGFCVLCVESWGLAPLESCIEIINRNGFLNIENFNKLKI